MSEENSRETGDGCKEALILVKKKTQGLALRKITESQNVSGWKGPLWVL